MITIRIAELNIGIDNKYKYIEHFASDYLTDAEPEFVVRAEDEEIEKEKSILDVEFSPGYLESIVVYRKIAEVLPSYDAFVFHGAVLNMDGAAYVFTAKSGVGKTTHTRLWLKNFGDRVHYLNGDKPIIRFFDGVPYACGTPWQGKENYGTNELAPLRAIAFVRRGEKNSATLVTPDKVTTDLITQMYLPRRDAATLVSTMKMANRLVGSLRLVELKVNMQDTAASIAHRVLSGEVDSLCEE